VELKNANCNDEECKSKKYNFNQSKNCDANPHTLIPHYFVPLMVIKNYFFCNL